jgi:hypothetical protein
MIMYVLMDMLITLIWSFHHVYIYQNTTLYCMSMYNYYADLKYRIIF